MSSAFNLDFEVSGIHGFVMMDSVMPALTEITCTFWMKSLDTTNYGTPVSYAVEGSDNAFLLIDYNGSVIYQEFREYKCTYRVVFNSVDICKDMIYDITFFVPSLWVLFTFP